MCFSAKDKMSVAPNYTILELRMVVDMLSSMCKVSIHPLAHKPHIRALSVPPLTHTNPRACCLPA
jgi:hypothetical protein